MKINLKFNLSSNVKTENFLHDTWTLATLGIYFIFRIINYLNINMILYFSLIRLVYFKIKIIYIYSLKK